MTVRARNPYQLYCSFVSKSDSLNRVLYAIHDCWGKLEIPANYEDANRFSHLIMFLSQIMAFEAFVARCLRDECGLTPRQIRDMGNVETRVRILLPGLSRDADLSARVAQISWAFEFRHTWMHGCGDPTLTTAPGRGTKRGRKKSVPRDVFDVPPYNGLKWVDGHVWSKAAAALPRIAEKIAQRFGWH